MTKTYRLLTALLFCTLIFSCNRPAADDTMHEGCGTYILNNGNWGDNDSGIGMYDSATKTYVPDIFYTVNGQRLGDLGQDLISFEDRIYIAVNGSQTIFVTDTELKVLRQINAENRGTRLSPRTFAIADDKLYVTYYEGFVGEIRTEDCTVRLCPVGPNPDGIAAVRGSLYIAASGGMAYPQYNNTVSVVRTDTFSMTSEITVNINPAKVEASPDGRYVYVSSMGNHDDIPAMLQVIETETGKVTDLEYESVSSIAQGRDGILYILCGGYDSEWNPLPGTVYRHDMNANRTLGTFVADGTPLPDAYSISVARDGHVHIGCSDYVTNGDVYVFTPDGVLHDRFDSQGLNPLKAY